MRSPLRVTRRSLHCSQSGPARRGDIREPMIYESRKFTEAGGITTPQQAKPQEENRKGLGRCVPLKEDHRI